MSTTLRRLRAPAVGTHAWLIDLLAENLEVFRATPDGWLLAATLQGRSVVRAKPFDAVELELGRLWVP